MISTQCFSRFCVEGPMLKTLAPVGEVSVNELCHDSR